MNAKRYRAGLIGFGHWGRVLARNLAKSTRFKLDHICDRGREKHGAIAQEYSRVQLHTSADALFQDSTLDVVFIATQAQSHAELTLRGLNSGKHVFVEKPFVLSSSEAAAVVEAEKRSGKTVMVDHTLLFTGAFRSLEKRIAAGAIGTPQFLSTFRADFGRMQPDVDVFWHLLYHDLYLGMQLFGGTRIAQVSAHALSVMGDRRADVGVAHLRFEGNKLADLNAHLHYPRKVRRVVVGGENGLLEWDDTQPSEKKLRLAKKHVLPLKKKPFYEYSDDGDEYFGCDETEAIEAELEYFAQCLDSGTVPMNGSLAGTQVVKTLEDLTGPKRTVLSR